MSAEHVIAFYTHQNDRDGATFDVYVPGSGFHMRGVPYRVAMAHKRKLHASGQYSVHLNYAGSWDGPKVW